LLTRRHPHVVVFDVGKVLIDWDLRYLYTKLIPDTDQLDAFLRDVITTDWHFRHDAGERVVDNLPVKLAEHPDHAALIRAYDARWMDSVGAPIPGVWTLVEQLAARGVPLFCITNFAAEFWPRFAATHPIVQRFRSVLVSGDVKLAKPDPRIYRLAKAMFGLRDGEALFIDDRLDNIESAEREGFHGHHFHDAARLEADLRSRGLLA
jgi:2-haloacid dehalogenase